jgi:predicted phosphate transport protein (TIGR00153 family)
MGTFSRIFGTGNKALQKKADELLLKLSKGLQSASAKLCVATECWEEGKMDTLKELQEEIIELEREMDEVKEELVENILIKSAFMPQAALERHTLVKALDKVIDATENPIRMMNMGCDMKPPPEIREIGKKLWQCTDLLQDAVKNLYKDFKKTIDITHKLDILREETRDIQFALLYRLLHEDDFKSREVILFKSISERMFHVAQKAEDAGDYIRELAVKYSS